MRILALALILGMCGCKTEEERWKPFGREEAVKIHLSKEARELFNQFPLIQILDERLDYTSNVVFLKVRDEKGKEFEIFYRYWDGKWMKRTEKPDGSYDFEEMVP